MNNNSNKKTILYLITQSELGGAQQYIFDLAVNLKDEFNVIVASGEQGSKGELAKNCTKNGIKFYEIPRLKRAISPINDFLTTLEIKKLIKNIKPDIVHLNSTKISILGSLAKNLQPTSYKLIYTVHGWVFNEPLPRWKKLFYRTAGKLTASTKDRLICVSDYDKQTGIKEDICEEEKLVTVHNGLKVIDFLEKEAAIQLINNSNQNTPRPFGHPSQVRNSSNPVVIGSIGNLYKTKGFEYLIKTAKIVKDSGCNFKLIIIGEGREKENLEQLIKDLNLENNVFLVGKINNASILLKAFDIYVCSSIKEGFPYSVLGAMQAALPIVSTNVGGIPEMITHGQEGLLVNSKSEQKLADSIIKLIKDKELQKELSDNAKQKVLDQFSLAKMIKETSDIYQN